MGGATGYEGFVGTGGSHTADRLLRHRGDTALGLLWQLEHCEGRGFQRKVDHVDDGTNNTGSSNNRRAPSNGIGDVLKIDPRVSFLQGAVKADRAHEPRIR